MSGFVSNRFCEFLVDSSHGVASISSSVADAVVVFHIIVSVARRSLLCVMYIDAFVCSQPNAQRPFANYKRHGMTKRMGCIIIVCCNHTLFHLFCMMPLFGARYVVCVFSNVHDCAAMSNHEEFIYYWKHENYRQAQCHNWVSCSIYTNNFHSIGVFANYMFVWLTACLLLCAYLCVAVDPLDAENMNMNCCSHWQRNEDLHKWFR